MLELSGSRIIKQSAIVLKKVFVWSWNVNNKKTFAESSTDQAAPDHLTIPLRNYLGTNA